MADQVNHPTVIQKVAGQYRFSSGFSQGLQARNHGYCRPAMYERNFTVVSYVNDFLMGGVSAAISKTADAPIKRVKLLIQNQDEMIKSGWLFEPYKGIGDCFSCTIKDESVMALWRGYIPTQALNFAFKDYFKKLFNFKRT